MVHCWVCTPPVRRRGKKERKTYARCQACVKGALASKSHRPRRRGCSGRAVRWRMSAAAHPADAPASRAFARAATVAHRCRMYQRIQTCQDTLQGRSENRAFHSKPTCGMKLAACSGRHQSSLRQWQGRFIILPGCFSQAAMGHVAVSAAAEPARMHAESAAPAHSSSPPSGLRTVRSGLRALLPRQTRGSTVSTSIAHSRLVSAEGGASHAAAAPLNKARGCGAMGRAAASGPACAAQTVADVSVLGGEWMVRAQLRTATRRRGSCSVGRAYVREAASVSIA
jgi:hypothetical protein